ncbi:MAG: molybdopterin-dependent oxidoreductase [Rhodospirillaceae bacterium]|nr:molybdopterin-dependent oxidoreductase [Rhodospirillaceae bacterium]
MNQISTNADAYFAAVMAEFEAFTPKKAQDVSRRGFFKLSAAAGAGLVIAFAVNPKVAEAATAAKEFVPNSFVRVAPDGVITIICKGPEIGQGIKTAFPLIVAEELDAAWSDVKVEQALIMPDIYGRQSAGGSTSIPANWDQLRKAGGVARAMLVSAAAKQWGVKESELTAQDSAVIHAATGRKLKYGELAMKAAALPVPDPATVPFKTRDQYRLLGKSYTGVENLEVVTGKPLFGIDVKLPGMLYAAYEKCPATGGKVASANLDYIKTLPGVKDAFIIEGNGVVSEVMPGVAIVADSTWAAFRAKAALQIKWDESNASKDSWTKSVTKAHEIAGKRGDTVIYSKGDVEGTFKGAAKTVEAFYSYPFVPHATLEPQNTTAWLKTDSKGDSLEMWIPSQTSDRAKTQVAKILGLKESQCTLHQTRAGGGFGRRLVNDPACEAAAIAQRVPNTPIKLTWTREDDMRHDFYRVGGFHNLRGALDAKGKLVGWSNHFITFTTDGKNPVTGGNFPNEEFPLPLLAASETTQTMLPLMTPCGAWRAPRSNGIAFAVQSFINELAVAAGRDHIEFFLEILGEPRHLPPQTIATLNTGRAADVVKLAAEKAGWGKTMPKGRGLGFGFHFSHAGHVAEIAEVSVDANNKITVHKLTVAADIGPIINMSGAINQCQGAAVDGVSTMMNLMVNIENGRVLEGNFTEYPILRMKDAPQVDVHFIQSNNLPTGLGEPALPPAMPAIANAVFAASGRRLRSMPLRQAGLTT